MIDGSTRIARRTGTQAAEREIAYQMAVVYYNSAGLDRIIAAAGRAVELAKARTALLQKRKAAGTDDFNRGGRQQELLVAIKERLVESGWHRRE